MKGSKIFNHENTKFRNREFICYRVLVFSCFRGNIFAFHFMRLRWHKELTHAEKN